MRVLLACLLLALPVMASAETLPAQPILLWGFQRGCDPLVDTTREVQKSLDSTVTKPDASTYVLSPDPKLLGCQGAACAALVQRACPNAKGRVMGGIVDQNAARSMVRVRLWMHDLQTGKTIYHDNFCQNCTIASSLKINASEIAQYGMVTSSPGTTPMYCKPEEPLRELPQRSNKIYWTVFGKEHHQEAVRATVRKLVQLTGTEVPFEHQGKEYTLPVLRKIIAKEPGAQVLGAEVQANGKVEIFLYDGPTELIEIQKVECDACDKDSLTDQVRQTTTAILSHCFGDSCARAVRSRPPAEACRPFEVQRCGGAGDEAIPLVAATPDTSAGSSTQAAPTISPGLAKLAKGAVWGIFAASAATTAALVAANFSSAGQVDAGGGTTISNLMLPGIQATSVITIISLGLAIPTTIVLDRSTTGRSSGSVGSKRASEPSLGTLAIQCPN